MLRQVINVTTGSTGVHLTTAHTLAVAPDWVGITPLNARGGTGGHVTVIAATNVQMANSVNTTAQYQMTLVSFQGRLY